MVTEMVPDDTVDNATADVMDPSTGSLSMAAADTTDPKILIKEHQRKQGSLLSFFKPKPS